MICLVAPPYSGHLHPLIGIGRELAGIADVTVISTPSATRAASAAGLAFHPILAEREKLVWEIAAPGQPVKSNPLLLFRQLKANVSLQGEMAAALNEAFAELRPDLVIADFTLPIAGPVATRHGARWWTSTPSPCVFETPDGPPAYFGGLHPAESLAESIYQGALRQLTRFFKRTMFAIFRKTFIAAGLPSVYRPDGSERVYSDQAILACGIRELEFGSTFPPYFHFIGPSLYTPPGAGPEPGFTPGGRHVLITLGTHLAHHKDEIATAIRGLARSWPDWTFHFSDGGSREAGPEIDGNFHRYPFISYARHLSRYTAVIHHGGTGILLECLSRGIPAIVMPLDFDHFDNAARLTHLGLAVRVDGVSELPAAFSTLAGSELLRKTCEEFRRVVAGYDPGEIVRGLVKSEWNAARSGAPWIAVKA